MAVGEQGRKAAGGGLLGIYILAFVVTTPLMNGQSRHVQDVRDAYLDSCMDASRDSAELGAPIGRAPFVTPADCQCQADIYYNANKVTPLDRAMLGIRFFRGGNGERMSAAEARERCSRLDPFGAR